MKNMILAALAALPRMPTARSPEMHRPLVSSRPARIVNKRSACWSSPPLRRKALFKSARRRYQRATGSSLLHKIFGESILAGVLAMVPLVLADSHAATASDQAEA
jgi:hypothetical protein